MKPIHRLFSVALLGAFSLGASPILLAQTSSTPSVAEQELELKKKELELQQAKIDAQKAEAQKLELESKQLDVEKQKLALEQAKQDLKVKETEQSLAMQLQGDVLFDTGSASIKPGAKDTLDKVATILAAFPDGQVVVTGYADSRGDETFNLKLSRDRAEAVKTWLLAKSGASSERILAKGEGEDNPTASNTTAEGRQLNRRVEITVAKM